jgi:hypothetical protein
MQPSSNIRSGNRFLSLASVSIGIQTQTRTPVVVTVNPSYGSNATRGITVQVSDGDDVADVKIVNSMMNDELDKQTDYYSTNIGGTDRIVPATWTGTFNTRAASVNVSFPTGVRSIGNRAT